MGWGNQLGNKDADKMLSKLIEAQRTLKDQVNFDGIRNGFSLFSFSSVERQKELSHLLVHSAVRAGPGREQTSGTQCRACMLVTDPNIDAMPG